MRRMGKGENKKKSERHVIVGGGEKVPTLLAFVPLTRAV
jgi:hypothetical protein